MHALQGLAGGLLLAVLELRAELLQLLVRADLVGLDDLQQLRELGACRRLVVVRHRRQKRELNLAVESSTWTVADTIVHRLVVSLNDCCGRVHCRLTSSDVTRGGTCMQRGHVLEAFIH